MVKPKGKIVLIENSRIPWVEEFSKYSCRLLKQRGQSYSFVREGFAYAARKLFSGQDNSWNDNKTYLAMDRLLTYVSYVLEPLFEVMVPNRFARHMALIFEKTTHLPQA